MSNRTTVQRKSDREVVVTRTVDAPARLVFEAWTKADLFKQWWVPKSMGMTLGSCDLDVRVGGGYRSELSSDVLLGPKVEHVNGFLFADPGIRQLDSILPYESIAGAVTRPAESGHSLRSARPATLR